MVHSQESHPKDLKNFRLFGRENKKECIREFVKGKQLIV